MLKNSVRSASLVLSVAATLMATSARAQLIAYEGFDYAPGSQLFGTGQGTGGIGWATPWSATSAAIATNNAGSLSYGTLPTSGGRVLMGNFGSATASSQRLLPGNLGTLGASASGTIWISFLYQNTNPDQGGFAGFREAKLALFVNATTNGNGTANVNGTERLDVGTPNTYQAPSGDFMSLWTNGSSATATASSTATPRGTDPEDTVFIVLRLDVDNTVAGDNAYAWFNPDLSSEPTLGSAISILGAADLSGINALRLQGGNNNGSGTNAVFFADELRVGYTWADVVPEPSVATLIGIGLAGLLFARRKAA
jgi:hypothetical protein